jgi:hypothetical protein
MDYLIEEPAQFLEVPVADVKGQLEAVLETHRLTAIQSFGEFYMTGYQPLEGMYMLGQSWLEIVKKAPAPAVWRTIHHAEYIQAVVHFDERQTRGVYLWFDKFR